MNVKIPIGRLAERLSAVSGVSVQSAESFIKSFFELAADTLVSGEVLKIKGLGSFEPDPSNADFPVRFTPDKELADTLNAPFAEFEAETLRDDLSKPELELMAAVEAQQEEVSK
ncbi:MAG: HU family DNA-binding protein, partial [Duncaniella sp.]|nr:HU family DNA-binding protein [Duncaniella sp.]